MKGSSFLLWFFISGLVPIAGLLAAVFYRWEDRELRRQCPRCGRVVKLYDAKCMRCGEELAFPERARCLRGGDAGADGRGVIGSGAAGVGCRTRDSCASLWGRKPLLDSAIPSRGA